MLRRFVTPALVATVLVAACDSAPTTPPTPAAMADDYALVMFGEIGASLEGTMGTQSTDRPFDGASARRRLPDSLALSEEQRAAIDSIKAAFKEAHEAELAALRAIFASARAARQAGASREEVRAILLQAVDIAKALRPFVAQLHLDLWNVLTDEQKAWIIAHRPPRFPRPMAP